MANKWGYNIKYVDPAPGCKLKRPMYEIKPGVWVIRSQLPEHKEQRKQRYWANPQKEKDSWALYYSNPKNRTKALVKKRQFRKENKEHCWQQNNKWNNSEKGFIMNLYSSALREFKKGRHGKGIPIPLEFTKKTWWEHWLKQKKKYGMYCPYSKVLMTTIRGRGRGTSGGKTIHTNISKDQIWPGRGYTPVNLIFCAAKFNLDKGSITPDGCEAVIDVHQGIMDEWAKELVLKKEMRKVDITPFVGKELKKLKKSLSPVEYKRFMELTYDKARLERWRERQNARS